MNYRHIYHAGNFADIFKHLIQMLLIERLCEKEKPFTLIDTHAGIGLYELESEQAQKTGEYRGGVGQLLAAEALPEPLQRFRQLLLDFGVCNAAGEVVRYPGSPAIARSLSRLQDHLHLVELHPEDAATLTANFGFDRRITIHHMDGYLALKALLPPLHKRGLVLIDPPFEVVDEFDRIVAGMQEGYRRWATGQYAIWYPIKDLAPVRKFHNKMRATGICRQLAIELLIRPASGDYLAGCGMLLINPPWQLDRTLNQLLPQLQSMLEIEGGEASLRWLVGE